MTAIKMPSPANVGHKSTRVALSPALSCRPLSRARMEARRQATLLPAGEGRKPRRGLLKKKKELFNYTKQLSKSHIL